MMTEKLLYLECFPYELMLAWHNRLEGANWQVHWRRARLDRNATYFWSFLYSNRDYWRARYAFEIIKEGLPAKAAALALGVSPDFQPAAYWRDLDDEMDRRRDEFEAKRRSKEWTVNKE